MRIFPVGTQRSQLIKTASRFKRKSERWGLAGSGVLYYCPMDKTVLLLERSNEVESSGLWGIPGGAVKGTDGYYDDSQKAPEYSEEELRDSAFSEVAEEIGHIPEHDEEEGSHTEVKDNFPYTTFLYNVTPSQKQAISRQIRLNWESDSYEWFRIDFLPENIHPGVTIAINKLINKLA